MEVIKLYVNVNVMGHINLKTNKNIFHYILMKTCIYIYMYNSRTHENNFNNIVKNVTKQFLAILLEFSCV